MFREKLEEVNCDDYNKSVLDLYYELRDVVEEYGSSYEYLLDDVVDYDTAEEIAKRELNEGGLVRIYYFLGDANCNGDVFKINGYGNLENFTRQDVRDLKEEILEEIGDEEDEEE